jgi:hypothetical protein
MDLALEQERVDGAAEIVDDGVASPGGGNAGRRRQATSRSRLSLAPVIRSSD